jgi:hypothetical protein
MSYKCCYNIRFYYQTFYTLFCSLSFVPCNLAHYIPLIMSGEAFRQRIDVISVTSFSGSPFQYESHQ